MTHFASSGLKSKKADASASQRDPYLNVRGDADLVARVRDWWASLLPHGGAAEFPRVLAPVSMARPTCGGCTGCARFDPGRATAATILEFFFTGYDNRALRSQRQLYDIAQAIAANPDHHPRWLRPGSRSSPSNQSRNQSRTLTRGDVASSMAPM